MTKRTDTEKNRIQAVENAFEIVEEIQAANGCSVRDVGNKLDLPRSTAYIYIKTLEDMGYLRKSDGEYYVGIKFLKHGGHARHNADIYQIARQEVDKLANKAQSVATIGCEDDGLRVLLYRTESGDAVSDNPATGEYTKMHWTALGKALLSQKSNKEIKKIVERYGLPKATENTHTEIESLLKDIEEIRARGYAIGDEERSIGVKSIAMPTNISDDRFGHTAISIAGPTSRFKEYKIKNKFSTLIQETINIIQLKEEHY